LADDIRDWVISPFFSIHSRKVVTLAMVEARGLVVFVPYNAISQLVERGLLTVLKCPVHVSLAPLAAVFNVERARVEPAINLLIRHMSRSSVASS
jgi:DNA-binding transcriptional LysR family regulator